MFKERLIELVEDFVESFCELLLKILATIKDTFIFAIGVSLCLAAICMLLFLFGYLAQGIAFHFGIVMGSETLLAISSIVLISFLGAVLKNFAQMKDTLEALAIIFAAVAVFMLSMSAMMFGWMTIFNLLGVVNVHPEFIFGLSALTLLAGAFIWDMRD